MITIVAADTLRGAPSAASSTSAPATSTERARYCPEHFSQPSLIPDASRPRRRPAPVSPPPEGSFHESESPAAFTGTGDLYWYVKADSPLKSIKDATAQGENAADWPYVFVQGVGTYLHQFGGSEPLTGEQEMELANFMTNGAAGLSDFLRKMSVAQASGDVREYLRNATDLDPLDRALLEFLAN